MKGETIGIIGRNGAGKSTLLQLICGILKPTSGTVQVNGSISAMLELGAGFNPEFTGRENAYFQGFLMGFTEAQMRNRFDDIEAFADIGGFIDQPVRTYSSGMFMRIAFAVAVHVDPDILIIDEILAVGDAVFQQKCINLVNRLQSSGTSIVVVSHDPYHIERMCHKVAIMRQGRLSDLQPAKGILASYHELVQEELTQSPGIIQSRREGTQEVSFEKVFIKTSMESDADSVLSTEPLRIVADIVARQPIDNVHFRFELYSSANELVTVIATIGLTETKQFHGKHRIAFTMQPCQLTSGWHYITAIAGHKFARLDTWQRVVDFKVLLQDHKAQNLSMDQGVFVSQGQWEFSRQPNEVVCASD
ncbi:MAG: ABC transporter ATP-binding protein, partial [Gammaproteobacteria bacterium]